MSQQEQEERPPPEDQKQPEGQESTRSIFERVKERRTKREQRQRQRKQYTNTNPSIGASEYNARLARTQAELDELKILYSIKREIDELLTRRKESLRSESLI